MFKRLLAVLLCFVTLFMFVGCNDDDEPTAFTSSEADEDNDSEISVEPAISTVPNVVGKTAEEAKKMLDDAKLLVIEGTCYSETVEAGVVVTQSDLPDTQIESGSTVVILVSNGLSAIESAKIPMTDPLVASRKEVKQGENGDYEPINYEKVKGVWISQLDLTKVYYDKETGKQRSKEEFTSYIKTIMKNTKESGFNTVYVQTHPDCDTMFPSEYYPWSDYLFGAGNYGNTSSYDLLQIMLDEAHAQGLSFQAWINPMRGMAVSEMETVNVAYKIRQWADDKENNNYLFENNNKYYLNPAYEEVRQYIIDIAVEICRYYDVDGIHMDDYFYPSANSSFDKEEFAAQSQFSSLQDFRKNNVNLLVKGLYDAIKRENANLLFGISPAGNIENNLNNLGADVVTWCTEPGYIDYILPQIYFGFKHSTVPFDGLSNRWIELVTEESVDLYLGLGMHKIGKNDQYAGSNDGARTEWMEESDILKRSFEFVKAAEEVVGFSVFSYEYMFDPLTGKRVSATKEETDNFLPVMQSLWS